MRYFWNRFAGTGVATDGVDPAGAGRRRLPSYVIAHSGLGDVFGDFDLI